jgi:hypothetical protein
VSINNLDITTQGGAGRGANDGNDTINVSLNVLDHANPSFSLAGDINSLNIDLGTVFLGSSMPSFQFDIANLANTLGFTADLELDSIFASGDSAVLMTDLTTFAGVSALEAGLSNIYTATMSTANIGSFSATYTLGFSDEDLAGAIGLGDLTLNLFGSVVIPEPTGLLLISFACSIGLVTRPRKASIPGC